MLFLFNTSYHNLITIWDISHHINPRMIPHIVAPHTKIPESQAKVTIMSRNKSPSVLF